MLILLFLPSFVNAVSSSHNALPHMLCLPKMIIIFQDPDQILLLHLIYLIPPVRLNTTSLFATVVVFAYSSSEHLPHSSFWLCYLSESCPLISKKSQMAGSRPSSFQSTHYGLTHIKKVSFKCESPAITMLFLADD